MKMYKVKVIFIKDCCGLGAYTQIPELIEQEFLTDYERFEIPVPDGYTVSSITRYYPLQTITKK